MQSRGSYDLNATASREILRRRPCSFRCHTRAREVYSRGCLLHVFEIYMSGNRQRERERERERERDVTVTRERFGMFIFLENTRPSLGTRGNWEWALPRSRPWHRYCLKSCAFSLYRDKKKKRKSTTRDSYDSYDSVSNFHVEKKHFSFANASSSSFSSRRKRQQSFLSVHLQFR